MLYDFLSTNADAVVYYSGIATHVIFAGLIAAMTWAFYSLHVEGE